MYVIIFIITFNYENNHLIKILSSLVVKFDVQAKNYSQVKFINCYLREIISFTTKIDIRDWGQSTFLAVKSLVNLNRYRR